ncbi:hypothetical protein HAX54_042787 [Datura stramonium]|uniref:Uncharacterized protein n=1 Tax=Datura stramonium TaxID=4076 RepID=A0ABS8SMS8_DATST|nr:hypothetical protein [Datura stramonium]
MKRCLTQQLQSINKDRIPLSLEFQTGSTEHHIPQTTQYPPWTRGLQCVLRYACMVVGSSSKDMNMSHTHQRSLLKGTHEGPVYQERRVVDGAAVTTKEAVESHAKEGSDLSNEKLFEGNLMESKEGTYNVLQNEVEIIEGFMTALATRLGEIGGKTPSAEGGRSDIGNKEGLFVQESGE